MVGGGPVATPGVRPGGGAVVAGGGAGNWSGGGWRGRHHHHHRGFWPGFAIGAGIGSAYGYYGNSYYNSYYYDDPYYYDDTVVAAAPVGDDAVAYCMRRYKSYDPASGTYLGYDGQRHPCPAQ